MRLQEIKKWNEPENLLAASCEAEESDMHLILTRNPEGKQKPFCFVQNEDVISLAILTSIALNYEHLKSEGLEYAMEKAKSLIESAKRRFANNVFFYDSALDEWTIEELLADGFVFVVKYKDKFWRINHV